MSITGLAIIYIIIWWIVFFAILPIDVERKKIIRIDGEDPGSPENPKILKKFIYCTGITTVLFFIIFLLMKFEYLNLRNIIIWWIVFFAILPIDVDRIKIEKIEGEDPGSPENPKILKKFIYCTGITTILFTIIYLLMRFEYLNLRNIII